MGVFSGIGGARATRDANYIREGHFLMRIDVCRIGENRTKEKLSFIEGTIVSLLGDSVQRVGESVTKAVKASSDYFLPDILQFISAAAGVDVESASDEEREEAANTVFGEANPLAGTCVEVVARDVTTKKGEPYTKITFKREIPAAELLELPEEMVGRFWDRDALQRLAAAEAK